jgi:hypothetical protein
MAPAGVVLGRIAIQRMALWGSIPLFALSDMGFTILGRQYWSGI